jgi:hypothetical protein
MKWIFQMFKLFHLLPAFTADDVLNAEQEDALREHAEVVQAVKAQAEQRRSGNEKLRAALHEARQAMPVFGEFEHAMRSRERPFGVRRQHDQS